MATDRLEIVGIYAKSLVPEKYGRYGDDKANSGAYAMLIVTLEAIDPWLALFITA